MFIKPQRLEYKISPLDLRYSRKVQQNLAGSNETFSDLETPGWSSLMKSQQSDKTKQVRNIDKQQKQQKQNIYKKQEKCIQNSIYNKLTGQTQLKWSIEDQKKMIKTKLNSQQGQFKQIIQNNSRKTILPIPDHNNKNIDIQKRWNQITIHQYLYRNSIKQQNKKIINKLLDQQFKKKQIYKFVPQINKKSIILAQSKFNKVKNYQKQSKILQQTLQAQKSNTRQKQDKDIERYRTLNKLFYYLSQHKSILTSQSLQTTLQKLPLPCITVIQPLIQKIYKGQSMEWLDFLQNFNAKKVKGKEGFFVLINKWFTRCEIKDDNLQ